MKKSIFALAAVAITLAACSESKGWKLNGTAPEGVETVYVEAPMITGGWYTLDSAKVVDGNYSFALAKANSTIYRAKIGDKTIYLPADSTETLNLTVDGQRSGSPEAQLFNAVDEVMANGGDVREMLEQLNGNYASTAAYYATRLLSDFTLTRTVANRYNEEHPSDPRTAILLAEMKRLNPHKSTDQPAQQQVIYAPEIGYFDIELMDREGNMRKLSETVEENQLTILAYVDFANSEAQAITRALGDAQAAGAAIFEVGFEQNQHLWAEATQSLPWVNVYQSEAADDTHMGQYRVNTLPMFFVIQNGEITERITDYKNLPKK